MTSADIWTALPLLLLALGSLLILLVGALTRNDGIAHAMAMATTLVAALCALFAPAATLQATSLGLSTSILARTFTVFFCLLATGTLVFSRQYNQQRGMGGEEYSATLVFVTFGMVALAVSTNLLTLFLGLEAMTFGFYILVAFDLQRGTSGEAGLKYLLMGALSAAFLAFGIALLYCVGGTLDITRVMRLTLTGGPVNPVALAGWGCLLIGMAFKLSLVPAHLWTPDIYQGAPAPVVAFLSGGSKAASLLLLLMLLPQAGDAGLLRGPLWLLALLSMLVGNLAGLLQNRVRRMLAYSSIAQMGYVVLALIAGQASGSGGYQAGAYYALIYGVISLAAFGAIAVLERNGCGATLDDYRGRGATNPLAAAVLTLALFALAGIPPTAGFTGKFLIFASALKSGEIALAVLGILTAAVSVYYYLRVVTKLYFTSTEGTAATMNVSSVEALVLLAASALIVLMGLWPLSLLDLLQPLG
jgi:NADH-quinone oxidoreductase subunit N